MLNKSYAIECVTQIILIIMVCVWDRERESGVGGEREELRAIKGL